MRTLVILFLILGTFACNDQGVAYDKYQKCGVRGATRLFVSGWSDEELKFYEKGDF